MNNSITNYRMFFNEKATPILVALENKGWAYSDDGQNIKFATGFWEKFNWVIRYIFSHSKHETKLDAAIIKLFPEKIGEFIKIVDQQERRNSSYVFTRWNVDPEDFLKQTYESETQAAINQESACLQNSGDYHYEPVYLDKRLYKTFRAAHLASSHPIFRSAEIAYKLLLEMSGNQAEEDKIEASDEEAKRDEIQASNTESRQDEPHDWSELLLEADRLCEGEWKTGGVFAYDKENVLKAIDIYRQIFNQSLTQCRRNAASALGNIYSLGKGVPEDFEQAKTWWRKGADIKPADSLDLLFVGYYDLKHEVQYIHIDNREELDSFLDQLEVG